MAPRGVWQGESVACSILLVLYLLYLPAMVSLPLPPDYADWLASLKSRIGRAQQRAATAVNRTLVTLYWDIGKEILERQAKQGWGAKVIERLAQDLRQEFPDMSGLSRSNLMANARIRRSVARCSTCPTACWTSALGTQPGATAEAQID